MSTVFGTLQKDGTVTNEMVIDLNTLPSSDPLAFGYGVHAGKQYALLGNEVWRWKGHGSNHRELAPEYLRGFLLGAKGILVAEGTRFRKGQERSYFFSDKNILKPLPKKN